MPVNYNNTNISYNTDIDGKTADANGIVVPEDSYRVSESIIGDAAFLTSRLFGGPILMRDEIDPLISTTTASGGRYSIGRTTAQTIATNPTIVSICPGKAVMLPLLNRIGKSGVLHAAIDAATSGSDIDSFIKSGAANTLKNNRVFYRMGSAYNEYINYVNMIARLMAIYIGIGDEEVPYYKVKFKHFDWANYFDRSGQSSGTPLDHDVYGNPIHHADEVIDDSLSWNRDENEALSSGNNDAKDVFTYHGNDIDDNVMGPNHYIHFYTTANTSYDESTSTSTRSSAIASQFEGTFSDTVKDIQFLFGSANNDGVLSDISALFGSVGLPGGVDDFAKVAANYLKGGRIIFPDMVDDTTYNRGISLSMRFTAPAGDRMSIFLYCLLPLAHVMAFSYPKQVANNMYTYPFLVSCYCKGFFNCDMGVVTSVRIQRGGSDDLSWSADGLATDIEVSMEITPLHSELMISSARHPFLFLHNYGMQEYLGVICGTDMLKDNVRQQIDTVFTIFGNAFVRDKTKNMLRALGDWTMNTKLGFISREVTHFLQLP